MCARPSDVEDELGEEQEARNDRDEARETGHQVVGRGERSRSQDRKDSLPAIRNEELWRRESGEQHGDRAAEDEEVGMALSRANSVCDLAGNEECDPDHDDRRDDRDHDQGPGNDLASCLATNTEDSADPIPEHCSPGTGSPESFPFVGDIPEVVDGALAVGHRRLPRLRNSSSREEAPSSSRRMLVSVAVAASRIRSNTSPFP